MFYNTIKTIVLMTLLSLMLLGIGHLIGGQEGMFIALVMALLMNSITYFFSDKIVLRLYRAQPLSASAYPAIHEMVTRLAAHMHIPAPNIWIINSSVANAFATGRNPQHASIALTSGIVELLDAHELEGVIAHELSHVKNRDILIGSMAATLATAISYVAYWMRNAAMWGNYSNDNRRQNNPFALLILGMLMPLAATLVQLAISRSREYEADDSGARVTRDPLALASALQKLEHNLQFAHAKRDERYAPTSSLCIVKPFKKKQAFSLFATHPPMAKRIERLRKLHEQLF